MAKPLWLAMGGMLLLAPALACCQGYLADVLRRLPAHPINRVAELLPFRWQPLV